MSSFTRQRVTVLELDLDTCQNTYGVLPCTASGPVGSECYNTFQTCQDKPNFIKAVNTWFFVSPGAPVPAGRAYRPWIDSVKESPAEIDLEKGFGARGRVTVTMVDPPDTDITVDPYAETRPVVAGGTFWTRLLTRNKNYAGRFARLKTARLTDGWDDAAFSTELYVIERISGPDGRGRMTITLKDPIKLTDQALVPPSSKGILVTDLPAAGTAVSLAAGQGADYPPAGFVRIGDEIIEYGSNLDDVLGGLTRGRFGTTASDASAGGSVQICQVWQSTPFWRVLDDILLAAGLSPANIDSAGFQAEDDAWLGEGYYVTACISKPEKASKHLAELTVQVGGFMWWSPVAQKVVFRVLAPLAPDETVKAVLSDESALIEGSVKVTALEDLRRTQHQIWYALVSAVADIKEGKNFLRVRIHIDVDSEGPNEYNNIRPEIFRSRWFDVANDSGMATTTYRRVQYYRDAPRNISVLVDPKDAAVRAGDLVDLETAGLIDIAGQIEIIRAIVLRRLDESGQIRLTLRTLFFGIRAAFIAPDGTPDYPADPEWMHIAPDSEAFDDGTPSYQVF